MVSVTEVIPFYNKPDVLEALTMLIEANSVHTVKQNKDGTFTHTLTFTTHGR